MNRTTLFVLASAAISAATLQPLAAAQPADSANEPAITAPDWSTAETRAVGQMLSGVWKSGAVSQADGQGSVEIVMAIAPVRIEGVSDVLYVEAARADALWEPYRQAIFQVYSYKGGMRLRTYELRNNPGIKNAIVGFAYAPDLMPAISRDDLIATLDLDLTKDGAGYKGKTPYPYPTGAGGAVEMTSQFELSASRLVSTDAGYGPEGKLVWGSESGSGYVFARSEPSVSVSRTPEGVVMITLAKGEGESLQEGQLATVQYTGYLDDGYAFDSSRKRPQPMTFRWPGQLIAGWNLGVAGLTKGEHRRIIIPSDLGYGANGNPQARIPGNSRLTFDLECVLIQQAPTPGQAAPAGGH